MSEQTERAEKLRRGKLLLKLREKLIHIKVDDEGDRVYLRSTNDADVLKAIIAEIDDYGWGEFMREKNEPDIFESCRSANEEKRRLQAVLTEISGELGAALVQASPNDDQIIIDHIRKAHELAKVKAS